MLGFGIQEAGGAGFGIQKAGGAGFVPESCGRTQFALRRQRIGGFRPGVLRLVPLSPGRVAPMWPCAPVLVVGLIQAHPKPLLRRLARQRAQRMRAAFYVCDSALCCPRHSSRSSSRAMPPARRATGFGGHEDDDDDDDDDYDVRDDDDDDDNEEENNYDELAHDSDDDFVGPPRPPVGLTPAVTPPRRRRAAVDGGERPGGRRRARAHAREPGWAALPCCDCVGGTARGRRCCGRRWADPPSPPTQPSEVRSCPPAQLVEVRCHGVRAMVDAVLRTRVRQQHMERRSLVRGTAERGAQHAEWSTVRAVCCARASTLLNTIPCDM